MIFTKCIPSYTRTTQFIILSIYSFTSSLTDNCIYLRITSDSFLCTIKVKRLSKSDNEKIVYKALHVTPQYCRWSLPIKNWKLNVICRDREDLTMKRQWMQCWHLHWMHFTTLFTQQVFVFMYEWIYCKAWFIKQLNVQEWSTISGFCLLAQLKLQTGMLGLYKSSCIGYKEGSQLHKFNQCWRHPGHNIMAQSIWKYLYRAMVM